MLKKVSRLIVFMLFIMAAVGVSAQTVYVTPSGQKYHRADCRMVENVSESLSLTQALKIGFQPCKICHPPISATYVAAPPNTPRGTASTVQCRGITRAGTRCKHKTSIANGYCFQHNPD